MTTAETIDITFLARELGLPVEPVQRTLQLLDDGNTIPFITRYRKEVTGGLDEEQILTIQLEAEKLRLLAERKQSILRSIDSQGRLTPELAAKVNSARTLKWLEDVYLPYKPKKRTLATAARQRGLEPLAHEVLDAHPAASDLTARAEACIAPDNGLRTTEDVLQGIGHIIAEIYSERVDVRGRLRKALRREGVLTCTRSDLADSQHPDSQHPDSQHPDSQHPELPLEPPADLPNPPGSESGRDSSEQAPADSGHSPESVGAPESNGAPEVAGQPLLQPVDLQQAGLPPAELNSATTVSPLSADRTGTDSAASDSAASDSVSAADRSGESLGESAASAHGAGGTSTGPPLGSHEGRGATGNEPELVPATASLAESPAGEVRRPPGPLASKLSAKKNQAKRQLARERKKRMLEHAFKDYYNFREALTKLPPHRILAINRGERARVLRVRVDYDADSLIAEAVHFLVPPGHPHETFLRTCARDAVQRLVLPSLERELRRELAEEAEHHAVQVFIRNLRKLLLQPPVRGKRVLAVDPGFRSGCKLAAVDAFGNVLDFCMIHLVGSDEQRAKARATLVSLLQRYSLELIAIGNGAGCRAAEQIVSDVIGTELSHTPIAYQIVNEAGASFYSTSQVGRDELPHFDPMMRSAVSIGRRLQDPLSELVKINPANIGVGMYQHDMKAKHLRESLDTVVNSCVNYVGVDLNSASPSLLRYVSGMNQLTARRIYEFRQQHGPFRNRQQLKEVPGIGDATFIQAAGFLRVLDGDNPLDATWIHPESYEIALRILERLNIPVSELTPVQAPPQAPIPVSQAATAPRAETTADQPTAESLPPPVSPEPLALEPAAPDLAAAEPAAAAFPASGSPDTCSSAEGSVDCGGIDPLAAGTAGETTPPQAGEPSDASQMSPVDGGPHRGIEPTIAPATDMTETNRPSLSARLAAVDVPELSRELGIGEVLLRDILAALAKPGRDPRDDFSPPPFRTGIMRLEDLKPGMELQATVLNVVDFGAFVDVGISDSALIHISKLADQFIRDPQEVVSVGDFLKVWVLEVDKGRRRVSLTALDPHAVRKPRERREQRPRRPQQQPSHSGPPPTSGTGTQQGPPARGRQPVPGGAPSQGRPPAAGRQPPRRGGKPPQPARRPAATKPPPPKPVRPITPGMLSGKQPMRSFSDLMQFYTKKQPDPDEEKK